jgi:secondary thiamine-phosphate synthase enzyme
MLSEVINLTTSNKEQFVDITAEVQQAVDRMGVSDGLCTVFCPHTTAGVTINENADPNVSRDILNLLGQVIPASYPWTHSEGNSPAHIKASLLGSSACVIIDKGKLRLGTWQGVFFCEFDGPRSRRVWVKTTSSA